MTTPSNAAITCQLCGFVFDPTTLSCHTSCPLHHHCTVICCPHCGYQVVDGSRSRFGAWLERVWRPKRTAAPIALTLPTPTPGCCPLLEMPVGQEAEIEHMDGLDPARLSRLSIYGLAPGCRVCLLQRRPACVVRTGETELALSHEILALITVRPVAAA